jgi:DNA-binding MarR family transcriptional regulator
LAYLVPEGRRLSEFAELSGQHKQVIGTIADELEALGYVVREPDPSDGRAKLLKPTAKGRRQVMAARKIIDGLEAQISDRIGAERMAEMKSAMLAAAAAI